jgi:hypothetical protein
MQYLKDSAESYSEFHASNDFETKKMCLFEMYLNSLNLVDELRNVNRNIRTAYGKHYGISDTIVKKWDAEQTEAEEKEGTSGPTQE